MEIICIKMKGEDLKPGDLFSRVGDEYWNGAKRRLNELAGAVGEKVYIRTEAPCPKDQENEIIYKIEIKK